MQQCYFTGRLFLICSPRKKPAAAPTIVPMANVETLVASMIRLTKKPNTVQNMIDAKTARFVFAGFSCTANGLLA